MLRRRKRETDAEFAARWERVQAARARRRHQEPPEFVGPPAPPVLRLTEDERAAAFYAWAKAAALTRGCRGQAWRTVAAATGASREEARSWMSERAICPVTGMDRRESVADLTRVHEEALRQALRAAEARNWEYVNTHAAASVLEAARVATLAGEMRLRLDGQPAAVVRVEHTEYRDPVTEEERAERVAELLMRAAERRRAVLSGNTLPEGPSGEDAP